MVTCRAASNCVIRNGHSHSSMPCLCQVSHSNTQPASSQQPPHYCLCHVSYGSAATCHCLCQSPQNDIWYTVIANACHCLSRSLAMTAEVFTQLGHITASIKSLKLQPETSQQPPSVSLYQVLQSSADHLQQPQHVTIRIWCYI